ncbi:MAG: DUF11 domain-containing protein [Thermoguttaceae bacterium]|nr:DUF11 domain-containing protein [Thermoguttaceae bacterium]
MNAYLKLRRIARIAAFSALALIALADSGTARAQVAGFASSRVESAGTAESGSKRSLNLNPFKRAVPDFVDQDSKVVQPIAASRTATTSRSRQLAAESETPLKSRPGVVSSPKPRARSVDRPAKSRPRVAASLLDELEEDLDGAPSAREAASESAGSRRSLRDNRGVDDLELLADEETEIATDADEPVVSSVEVLDDDSFPSDDSSALVADVLSTEEVATEDDSIESLDSRFEAYRDGGDASVSETIDLAGSSKSAPTEEVREEVRGRAPIVAIETIGSKKLVVGQESIYKVVVRNEGAESARKLVVTTILPDSVEVSSVEAEVGSAKIQAIDDRPGERRCAWQVGTLEPKRERVLEIKLTPVKRAAFELVSDFEFERQSARADVEVQEPILEALVEGRDSIEWGVEDKFRIRLRNVGNGDAENVELFVSTGENQATQKLGVLKAGEEKTIETSVKTVSDDFMTIAVEATAAYGAKAAASKKIGVLRGKLDVEVEAPELQFVDGEFDATIRVRNLGDATLRGVDIVAQIPEGVEPVFVSNQARRNPQKRRVYWSSPFLRPNEENVFRVTCRVNKTGDARFEVVGVDQTGVAVRAESTTSVESIAVLTMRLNAPKSPVAVGKRCVYELVVENKGAKDARDIDSGVFLGSGLRPIAVEDGKGVVYREQSKALFEKIALLKAGESVSFRVEAEAIASGNQKVQAMLRSDAEDSTLMSEETTYCYSRAKKEAPVLRDSSAREPATMTADRLDDGVVRK